MTQLTFNTIDVTVTDQRPVAPAAPNLTVLGNVITTTLSDDPESFGLPILSRGLQYSTDEINWTDQPAVTAPENIPRAPAPDLLYDTDYYVQWRAVNANGAGDWSPSALIRTDVDNPYIPPTILNVIANKNGSTGYTGSAELNKPGTLYRYVSTNSTETSTTIMNNGMPLVVGMAGTVPLSGGGLTANTIYYLHLAFSDGTTIVVASSAAFMTDPQGTGTGSLTMTIERANSPAVVPHQVCFAVSVSGASLTESALNQWDPTFAGLVYIWDWDDPGAVSDKVVNVPTQWNDLNVGYGKYTTHVYTNPGTYNPVCRCYEQDGTFVGEATVQVVVSSIGSAFPGSRTILVDPDNVGDATNYPGAAVFTTFNAAYSALQALNQTGCILLKRGTTTQRTTSVVPAGTVDNFYLGAWGTGARPILELPNSNSISAGSGSNVPGTLFNLTDSANYTTILTGIDFIGPWDSATETGGQYRLLTTTMVGDNRRVLLDDCKVDGFAWALGTLSNGTGQMAECIHNCDITNWGDYGTFISSNRNDHLAIIGTAIHQKADSLLGGDAGKDFRSTQHGPIRASMRYRTYFDVLDIFARGGWFKNNGNYGQQPTSQPCIRAHFSTDFTPAVYPGTTLSRIACEGGGEAMIQIKDENKTGTGGAVNLVLDKVLMAATACTWVPFQVQWTGWTLRNCLIFIPDQATRTDSWKGFFNDFQLGVSPRADNPVKIYNVTGINYKSIANLDGVDSPYDAEIDGTKLATDYTNENNAIQQLSGGPTENINVNETTNMPTVGGVWTSRFLGTRWSDVGGISAQLTMNTALASPANLVKTAIPNVGSPILGDATTGLSAYDDFYGTVRPAARNRGAIQT